MRALINHADLPVVILLTTVIFVFKKKFGLRSVKFVSVLFSEDQRTRMNHLQRRARERSYSCQVEDLQVSLEELQLVRIGLIYKENKIAEAQGIPRMISIHEKCDERTGDEVFEK